jgi:DNA-binding SARP family transcriptional activator/pimeloyl-ACP methyl ester carboxylesterase
VEFGVLGPLQVARAGTPLAVGGLRTREVLAMLLVNANRVVAADRLAGELWPALDRERAAANLQVRLAELRRVLRMAGETDRIITCPPGYLLQATPGELDVLRFEQLVRTARAGSDAGAAALLLDEALALWRGPAFADLGDAEFAVAERTRLEEARLAAVELRMDALLDSGRHAEIIAELERLTADHALRERFWYQRLLALYRCGRQADALRAYRSLRSTLIGQLGIEPGPDLRELEARILRQEPALDRRQPDPALSRWRPDPADADPPMTRYVQSGGLHIAYQVLGSGERDIVLVPGLLSHLELLWEDPETAGFYRRLAALGRLILFDKRDTGMSDRSPRDSSLEERMDDVQAVMRAAGSGEACLFGYSEGGPMSILFAATYPDRVTSLILGSASARWFPAPGYPCGAEAEDMYQALTEIATYRWGQGATADWYLTSRAGSPQVRRMVGRFERMAISPAAFLRMLRMIHQIDVRAVLPAIHVPTLVIQRLGDRITPPCHGRYLASRIAGARYFEQPGDHSLRFSSSGDMGALFRAVQDFLTGGPAARIRDRVLATILLVAPAAGCGDVIRSHLGRLVEMTDAGALATFDTPGRAIRCAALVRDAAAAAGIAVSAGIHTGEVELRGDQIDGASVRVTRRVLPLARPGEILVSRTVKDLVAGSGIAFADRGSHEFGGELGAWQVFAVS